MAAKVSVKAVGNNMIRVKKESKPLAVTRNNIDKAKKVNKLKNVIGKAKRANKLRIAAISIMTNAILKKQQHITLRTMLLGLVNCPGPTL